MDYQEALKQAIAAAQMQPAVNSGDNAYNEIQHKSALAEQYARQRLSERISAAAPMTVQNRDVMAGNAVRGAISSSGQNYAKYLNDMVSRANAAGEAQSAGFTSVFNAAENAATMNKNMNDMERFYKLFMHGKMTSAQFKKKTGIDAVTYSSKRKPKSPEDQLAETANIAVDKGILTPNEAAAMVRQGNDYSTDYYLDKIVNWKGN